MTGRRSLVVTMVIVGVFFCAFSSWSSSSWLCCLQCFVVGRKAVVRPLGHAFASWRCPVVVVWQRLQESEEPEALGYDTEADHGH